jgi:hypothetical protein
LPLVNSAGPQGSSTPPASPPPLEFLGAALLTSRFSKSRLKLLGAGLGLFGAGLGLECGPRTPPPPPLEFLGAALLKSRFSKSRLELLGAGLGLLPRPGRRNSLSLSLSLSLSDAMATSKEATKLASLFLSLSLSLSLQAPEATRADSGASSSVLSFGAAPASSPVKPAAARQRPRFVSRMLGVRDIVCGSTVSEEGCEEDISCNSLAIIHNRSDNTVLYQRDVGVAGALWCQSAL